MGQQKQLARLDFLCRRPRPARRPGWSPAPVHVTNSEYPRALCHGALPISYLGMRSNANTILSAGERWCPNLRHGHPESEHPRRMDRTL